MAAVPTDILREEHRVILDALSTLEGAAARAEAGRPVSAAWWSELIGWLRTFADRNHHAKEEDALFPAMIKAGVPSRGGPIDVMLEEHEQGRALIAGMERSGPSAGAPAARRYADLLRGHIDKEHGIVFPLADAVLDPPAVHGLAREFDALEADLGSSASIAGAEAILARLAAALAQHHAP